MARLHTSLSFGGLVGCILASWACGGDDGNGGPVDDGSVDIETPVTGDGATDFVSSLPVGDRNGATEGAASPGAVAPERETADDAAGDGASRAISEADILQLSGDRLYALSAYNGLTVIDASNPAALRLDGSYRIAAQPFEMYVEDGIVVAMFNGWSFYDCDDAGSCGWQTESRVQAIDTRDPANIRLLADLEVPGVVADSRRVGDVMYLVTEESGYCWGCQGQANTTITSFDVSDPTLFTARDQLSVPNASDTSRGGRSIAVTDQRIYIGGSDYDTVNNQPLPATIQVVDISDPAGALVRGTQVNVAGPVQNRWQMDEYDGVFRVITQPGGWGTDQAPVVQTFRVSSSADIQPAGSLTVQLPRPREVLQSVRFDAARAYAITAEQHDPLFTFDLSDPAAPKQLGELEMPGWVYHMEPRGNRMYALGYDPQATGGSLHVSLFDVEDLNNPVLLARVPFGGYWGGFAEGQNQIHKAFSILPEQGLIMVPFSGSTYDIPNCGNDYVSGIQLIDFTENTLTRRGVAPQVGTARRALIHRDHLFGVSDNAVQTFDISNRDAPVETSQLDVARNVSTVRVLGDHLMRFGVDWNTSQTILDMTPIERASEAEPQAEIDLAALFGADDWSCGESRSWGGQVFTRGGYAYVPQYGYAKEENRGYYLQQLTLYIVDLTDPNAPRAVGKLDVEPANGDTALSGIVQADNALLVGRSQRGSDYDYQSGTYGVAPRYFYDVIELSNPSAPTVASRFELPAPIASGGWGRFAVGSCSLDMGWGWVGGGSSGDTALRDGDIVISQHIEAVPGNTSELRYYLDRIDVSDPYEPRMLPPINIPGTPIHFNGSTNELVTVDYQETIEAATSWDDCASRGAGGWTTTNNADGLTAANGAGPCHVPRRSINSLVLEGDRAVRKSQLLLDRTRRTSNIAVSNNRIFYTTTELFVGGYKAPSEPVPASSVLLESLRLDGGQLTRLPTEELRKTPSGRRYYGALYARDERAFEVFDNTVTVVDTLDPSKATRLSADLPNWGCQSLEVAGDTAYCASGQRGVEVIDLSSLR